MTGKDGGEQTDGAEVPRHLSEAHHHLLMALLHLAAVEGDVTGKELLRSRKLIADSLDGVETVFHRRAH